MTTRRVTKRKGVKTIKSRRKITTTMKTKPTRAIESRLRSQNATFVANLDIAMTIVGP
jgi:hypothetical protein